jgi:hypothetical protein
VKAMINPKEKIPIVSDNMNSITFRPQTINPITEEKDKGDLSSKELGNEVRNAVEAFEQKLANDNNFQ